MGNNYKLHYLRLHEAANLQCTVQQSIVHERCTAQERTRDSIFVDNVFSCFSPAEGVHTYIADNYHLVNQLV